MQNFNEFKENYVHVMNQTREEVLKYPWADKKFYTAWVGQIYFFLCQSTRMIPFAASRFNQEDEHYFNRCIEHSNEEKGHQNFALNDLKHLSSSAKEHALKPATEQLYSYPYHVIANVDPIGIFGINAFMEGLSIEVGKDVTKTTIETFGKKACAFLISHTHDDEDHIKEVFKALETLTPERLEIVNRVFLGSNDNFLKMLVQIS